MARLPGRKPATLAAPQRKLEPDPDPSIQPGRPVPLRFRDALAGVWNAYQEEPNLRFHLFAASGVLVLAYALRVSGVQALYLLGTVTLVLVAELVNTGIERAVDLAAGGRAHGLARQAKDAAAGAVLVAVLHATAAGWWILVQPRGLARFFPDLLAFAGREPGPALAGACLVLLTGLAGLFLGRQRKG